ncbi:MAG TPA: hypothetical protein DCO75_08920 [Fibrobacteres bacterium]|nr:hypothetical protein [Fibrobacterota bacterium]
MSTRQIKISFLIILSALIFPIYSWSPDTSQLFWNRDIIIEFGYGYSYVNMGNINKYYLEDFGKKMGLFDKTLHFTPFLSPEFGLVFTNNIISLSYQYSNTVLNGKTLQDMVGNSLQSNLYVSLWTINGSFRRLLTIKPFLIGLGASLSIGKGSAYLGSEFEYETAKQEDLLSEGLGGGGSIFGEIDYIVLKRILLECRISMNILLTETLKDNYYGKWIVDDNGHEINLDYSGVSSSLRIGFLW